MQFEPGREWCSNVVWACFCLYSVGYVYVCCYYTTLKESEIESEREGKEDRTTQEGGREYIRLCVEVVHCRIGIDWNGKTHTNKLTLVSALVKHARDSRILRGGKKFGSGAELLFVRLVLIVVNFVALVYIVVNFVVLLNNMKKHKRRDRQDRRAEKSREE